MALKNYFKRQYPMPGLLGIEKLAVLYAAFTLLLTAVLAPDMDNSTLINIIGGRIAVAVAMGLLFWLYKQRPCHATYHLRVILQVLLLGYWYPDIYNFTSVMPNHDEILAIADQVIFGCQPALVFSQILSGSFWHELFCLGYASYFFMIMGIVLLVILKRPRRMDSVIFLMLCTFFLYYVVFVLFSTAGPQFYFRAPGVGAANEVFPFVDDWFRTHSDLVTTHQGPFSYLVYLLHGSEKPIAAFPSSHVGISTVILILAFRLKKLWGWIMLPFYILLCLSTVYIRAHYAVDVVAGWGSAFLFLYISRKLYHTKFFHRPEGFDSLHRYGHHHTRRRHHRHH